MVLFEFYFEKNLKAMKSSNEEDIDWTDCVIPIDFQQDSHSLPSSASDAAPNAHACQADAETQADQQAHLAKKRAWDVAMAPAKSLPMNAFMMYMAGRTVSTLKSTIKNRLYFFSIKNEAEDNKNS